MKRSVKNIISIVLILLLCGSIFGTMFYAKNHIGPGMKRSMPQNSSNSSTSSSSNDSSSTSTESNSNGKQFGQRPNMPNGDFPSDMKNKRNHSLPVTYYVVFGLEGFLLSLILITLVFSSFHKKTIKETWGTKKKALLQIVIALLLTSGITFLSGKLTTSYFHNARPANMNPSSTTATGQTSDL